MPVTLGNKCLLECDLIIVSGASASFEFSWEKEGPDGTLAPADLNGASALCQIREANNERIVFDLSPFVIFDGGSIFISAPASSTSDIPPGKYVWDMMVTEPNDSVTRFAAGKVTVIDPISEAD